MKGELLSLETTHKLARYDKTIKYIKEKINSLMYCRDERMWVSNLEAELENILDMLEVKE